MPWRFVVPALLIAAAIALVLWLLLRPRQRSSSVGSYGDVRRAIIGTIASDKPDRGEPPSRPAALDTRLPAAIAAELRRIRPPKPEQRKRYFQLCDQLIDSIRAELTAIDPDRDWYDLLTPGRRAVIIADYLRMEVNNGGFDQYYLNSSGDGAVAAPAALRMLNLESFASLVERANAHFIGGPPVDRALRLAELDKIRDRATETWNALDQQFYDLETDPDPIDVAKIDFILAHEPEFFKQ